MHRMDSDERGNYYLKAISPRLAVDSSIAIVGSSSGLRGRDFGEQIDSHKEVVRFNGAITDGFQRDVGYKTTMQVIGVDIAYLFNPRYKRPSNDPEIDESNRYENAKRILEFFPDARIVTFHPNDADRNARNRQYMTAHYLKSVAPDKPVWYFEEDGPGSAMFYHTLNRDLEDLGLVTRLRFGGPRTGIKIVLRCVLAGLRPKLFGFDTDIGAETARHYHDDITKTLIQSYKPHDVLGEMKLLLEMHQKNLIEVFNS